MQAIEPSSGKITEVQVSPIASIGSGVVDEVDIRMHPTLESLREKRLRIKERNILLSTSLRIKEKSHGKDRIIGPGNGMTMSKTK